MSTRRTVDIPSLVRIKPGALDRIGVYLGRRRVERAGLFHSEGLPELLVERVARSVEGEGIELVATREVRDASLEGAQRIVASVSDRLDALIGLGGGRALDVAKYAGFLLQKPFFSVPASLSNDGFCSPQSSLTVAEQRRALPSGMPFGVVVDTEVCLQAP